MTQGKSPTSLAIEHAQIIDSFKLYLENMCFILYIQPLKPINKPCKTSFDLMKER